MASKTHFEYRALTLIDRAPGPVRWSDVPTGLRAAMIRLSRRAMVRMSVGSGRTLYITPKGWKYYTDLRLGLIEWR